MSCCFPDLHKSALAESQERQAKLVSMEDENKGLMARVADYEAKIADYKERIEAVELARDQSTTTVRFVSNKNDHFPWSMNV
jgi:phosphoheptose isomerase